MGPALWSETGSSWVASPSITPNAFPPSNTFTVARSSLYLERTPFRVLICHIGVDVVACQVHRCCPSRRLHGERSWAISKYGQNTDRTDRKSRMLVKRPAKRYILKWSISGR